MTLLIELENKLSEMDRLAAELDQFCVRENIPAKTGLELNLVLEEVVTNIISYAYNDTLPHRIMVFLEKEDDRVRMMIKDDGLEFNPLEVPPPEQPDEIDSLEPGGLGIHLMRKLTDEAAYQREDTRNILTLIKNLPTEAHEA